MRVARHEDPVAPPAGTAPTRARRARHLLTGGLAVLAVALAFPVGPAAAVPAPGQTPPVESPEPVSPGTPGCVTPDVPGEPPCNPALPASPWGVSHRNAYAQASSPYPGPEPGQVVTATHEFVPGIPVQLQFSDRYPDGGIVVWGSVVNAQDTRTVFKVDFATGDRIDTYVPAEREADPPPLSTGGVTGAYNLLDVDGRFIVPRQREIEFFADSVPGDRRSPIALLRRFTLPERALCRPDDVLVGATMTYDGRIAFATELGMVGTLPRDPEALAPADVRVVALNGTACADPAAPRESLETVSNSIAADEDGGIYVVTSEHQYRVDAGALGEDPRVAWRAAYPTGGAASSLRLGEGSGSTPTLMGTGSERDRFVVITDGRDLMHLLLLWRDEIPEDWQPLRPGLDRRIACEVPLRFGEPEATRSLSEQSVAVRGNAAYVVDNLLAADPAPPGSPQVLANALAALAGGDPAVAPTGFERIDWDPVTRTCRSVWANTEVSIPNAIPSMSAASGLVYGVGQRDGQWRLFGLDADTGRTVLDLPSPNVGCSAEAREQLANSPAAALLPTIDRLPLSCENSFYAATEVGPEGTVWSGTFLGYTVWRPEDPSPPPAGVDDAAAPVTNPGGLPTRPGVPGVEPPGQGSLWVGPVTAGVVFVLLALLGGLVHLRRRPAPGA